MTAHVQLPVQLSQISGKMAANIQLPVQFFSPVQSHIQYLVNCVKTTLPVQYLYKFLKYIQLPVQSEKIVNSAVKKL